MKKLNQQTLANILQNTRFISRKKAVTFTNKEDYSFHTKLERKMSFQLLIIFILNWLIMIGIFKLLNFIVKGNAQYYLMIILHLIWIVASFYLNRLLFFKRFNNLKVSDSYYELFQ